MKHVKTYEGHIETRYITELDVKLCYDFLKNKFNLKQIHFREKSQFNDRNKFYINLIGDNGVEVEEFFKKFRNDIEIKSNGVDMNIYLNPKEKDYVIDFIDKQRLLEKEADKYNL